MHPTIQRVLETIPERYCRKSEFADQLAKILKVKPTMGWRKQVYRWINFRRTAKGWVSGGTVYTPRTKVLKGMEMWLKE